MDYIIYLNCTNDSLCDITKKENKIIEDLLMFLNFFFSSVGIIFNTISVFILTFRSNSSSKFLKFLKFYAINSLAISLNDFWFIIICIFTIDDVYIIEERRHHEMTSIFYPIIYLNFWMILYTFSGILDIFIVYERIQIYLQNLKFLRNKSAALISICVLIYSVVFNIPVFISMRVHDDIIKIQSNELIEIRLGKYIFSDKLFILVIICNLARDVISFVIEITINIILMLIMISYYKKRLTINISNPIFLERKRTDIKIALLMNFISVLFRLMFFSVIIILVLYFPFYLRITLKVLILLFSLRHSLNFFLFLRFNK